MSKPNPFDDPSGNPWGQSSATNVEGPRFGNAYDDSQNAWQPPPQGSASFVAQRMPSPSDYRAHMWSESNKTEETNNTWDQQPITSPAPVASQDAYQYAGTRLGTQLPDAGNAYSSLPSQTPSASPLPTAKPKPLTTEAQAALPPVWDDSRMNPSKLRLLLRFLQFLASVGHLGFAAGASPFSNHPVPLPNQACFYYLFAVAILSILWTAFHLGFFCYRRFFHGHKLRRPVMIGIDLLLAVMWGIGVIIEIAKFRCPPGGFDKWCDFYNVSIFWGMLAFVLYIAAVAWDIVGACVARQR
ncbi:hypothetical protein DFQ28_007952 [Apophysomyces sp. BC1034]|nr:hypothetical protein DFQ30_007727 [Apophysomyces sp. BC1015]KAG0175930.1 hypothetical protein DFQ29_006794 [Apophysomyces sp. BC1021]KAG0186374.1 hypothetical protein DFQ28_007952 [Apophysomyces sp. BC1034]